MMFASKTPRDLNRDPYPWVTQTGTRGTFKEKYAHIITFSPRPEYDVTQINEPNPILVEFRKLHSATGNPLLTDAYLACSDLVEETASPTDEYGHAFEVLSRIVRLSRLARLEES